MARSSKMAPYIGTPTSRVDGHAKVTGAAKYAGEFNVPGLAYGAVVASTIAKGRIARIDASEALRVKGVIDVLTHENRPRMAATSSAYKDDVAPEQGSPFRPLYDDKILFNGQPIALVVAEEWEIARFAASLVRVEYEKQAHVTDLYRPTRPGLRWLETPERPRGKAEQAFAAAAVRHEAEYYIPIEHHNPMELFASTVMLDGDGKLTVYDKTQGVQNVQRYLCGVFKMKPDDVRVVSPFVGGAFGSGLRPQYQVVLAVLAARALKRSVRLVLTRQQMYGLGYRPAMIERLAHRRESRRHARRDHPRGDHGDVAIRGFLSQRHRLVRPALQERQREIRAQAGAARSCHPVATCAHRARRPASMRSNARWTNSRSRSSSIRSSCACAVIRIATSTRTFPTPARACANATDRAPKRSAGASATPSRARCATAASWLAGAWRPASGKRCRWNAPPASC